MVRLVRYEVRQDMPDIEREIPPSVGGCRRHPAATVATEAQQVLDGRATKAKGADEVDLLDASSVYQLGSRKPVRRPKSPDPHTPRIV